MKNFLVIVCLFLASTAATISKTPYHVEAINIDMNDDLLIATSNNPDDPMKQIRVFNSAGAQVAFKRCAIGIQCNVNLSSVPSGVYLAVANSLQLQYSENVFVE